jgi:PAS domain S-box-containing protein
MSPDLIVVTGFDGYLKRVNPAFGQRLGYREQETLARPFLEFVHVDDRERTNARWKQIVAGAKTVSFENRCVCSDGTYRWIEWTAAPAVEEGLAYAVGRDVTERRQAETDLRNAEERNRTLADEHAALSRVASLVAHGAPTVELFAAVVEEVGQLLGAQFAGMARYESDVTVTVVATWADERERGGAHPLVPGPWPLDGDDLASTIWRTGRPVRIDDYRGVPGPIAAFVRDELGVGSSLASPIVVEGRLWGALFVHTAQTRQPLPEGTESRLTDFTELVATAIANAESRTGLARLAEEQAALRRVATLVAQGVPPATVFSSLGEEVNRLLDADTSAIVRLDDDGRVTVVASAGLAAPALPPGARMYPEPGWVLTAALETGCPAPKEDYRDASEYMPGIIRDVGIRSAIGVPIVVEGTLWGVIIVGTVRERFPNDTERRLKEFTELAATAIGNAESRAALAGSRARIVAASDETRRRIERDLHDGVQQRLVSLSLDLRLADSIAAADLEEARRAIGRVAGELNGITDELREIARGIHPAILSEGGLGPALRTLARRSAIPIVFGVVIDRRLPEPIEVAAYYVVSEALANTTKHARATRVDIEATARESSLHLSIQDDGVGGADQAGGSGLVGLRDRVEALGGTIDITSPADFGTAVVVALPLELDASLGS